MKDFFIKKVLANDLPGHVDGEVGPNVITPPIDVDSIEGLLDLILSIVLTLGTPLIAIMIVYAGFLYLTAQGNEAKLTKAHTALLYTVIGAAIILGSFVIKEAIQGTITSLKP